ncbi:hypothetical protein F5Y04DRAFT_259232 [Hypomontagnella monticulosa]|nr:hypothetical protein F5Y04DRAFT_259232 [Hypomontagnella monticulosa]
MRTYYILYYHLPHIPAHIYIPHTLSLSHSLAYPMYGDLTQPYITNEKERGVGSLSSAALIRRERRETQAEGFYFYVVGWLAVAAGDFSLLGDNWHPCLSRVRADGTVSLSLCLYVRPLFFWQAAALCPVCMR